MRGMKVRDARGALLLALAPLACTSQVLPNSTTTSLGPGGGTAHSTDGLFSLIVPPNALTGPVDVVIETDTTGPLPGQLGAAYRVLPADLRFAEPATARRRLDARWVGELSLGSSTRARLPGVVFDAAGPHLDVRLLSVDCENRRCSGAPECSFEGSCVGGRCTSACASDYECERPADCATGPGVCPDALQVCQDFACAPRADVTLASTPAPPPTRAGVTCGSNTFVLFLHTREAPCEARGCRETCVSCDPSHPSCRHTPGLCSARGTCELSPSCSPDEGHDGWDDAPGTGRVFVVDTAAIAGPRQGFDLDERCAGPGGACVDNALWAAGPSTNPRLRLDLSVGTPRLLVELAGLDEPYTGEDDAVTVKLHPARDAEDPVFPANDFGPVAGDDTPCCQFELLPQSLTSTSAHAPSRLRARIRGGRLSTLDAAPVFVPVAPAVGLPSRPELLLLRARLSATIDPRLRVLTDVRLGGAIRIADLDQAYRRIPGSEEVPESPNNIRTWVDDAAQGIQPDIDLDLDGLESLYAPPGGRVQRCSDGCGPTCSVAPPLVDAPWSCVRTPELADGYSIALTLSAVAARVVRR
jgi:hypothetical protein